MKYFMVAALLVACWDKDTGEEAVVEEQDSAVEAEQNKKNTTGRHGFTDASFYLME